MAVNRAIGIWRHALERAVLPPRCLMCGELHAGPLDLCVACLAELPRNTPACIRCAMPLADEHEICGECLKSPPPFELAAVPWLYAGAIASLLPRFKFHAELACGRLLATLTLEALRHWEGWHGVDLVIPVPLHANRLRQRGYNQALELARPLAREYGLRLAPQGLLRIRETAPQTALSGDARRRNLRGAFAANGVPNEAGVLLIDDVFTTGATLREAATSLRRAGATRVHVLAMARVP